MGLEGIVSTHARCKCHDLAPVAQLAAWASACTRGRSVQ
jgi:hypothetical protein